MLFDKNDKQMKYLRDSIIIEEEVMNNLVNLADQMVSFTISRYNGEFIYKIHILDNLINTMNHIYYCINNQEYNVETYNYGSEFFNMMSSITSDTISVMNECSQARAYRSQARQSELEFNKLSSELGDKYLSSDDRVAYKRCSEFMSSLALKIKDTGKKVISELPSCRKVSKNENASHVGDLESISEAHVPASFRVLSRRRMCDHDFSDIDGLSYALEDVSYPVILSEFNIPFREKTLDELLGMGYKEQSNVVLTTLIGGALAIGTFVFNTASNIMKYCENQAEKRNQQETDEFNKNKTEILMSIQGDIQYCRERKEEANYILYGVDENFKYWFDEVKCRFEDFQSIDSIIIMWYFRSCLNGNQIYNYKDPIFPYHIQLNPEWILKRYKKIYHDNILILEHFLYMVRTSSQEKITNTEKFQVFRTIHNMKEYLSLYLYVLVGYATPVMIIKDNSQAKMHMSYFFENYNEYLNYDYEITINDKIRLSELFDQISIQSSVSELYRDVMLESLYWIKNIIRFVE